jgi:hypothetical protein
MSYKIPSDEEVLTAIQRVISRHHTITSQGLLKKKVEDELRTLDKKYRVGGSRLRKLALKSKYFHLEIDYKQPPEPVTKEGEKAKQEKGRRKKLKKKPVESKLKACPVCGSKVKKIKNKTLKGGFITTGYRCT